MGDLRLYLFKCEENEGFGTLLQTLSVKYYLFKCGQNEEFGTLLQTLSVNYYLFKCEENEEFGTLLQTLSVKYYFNCYSQKTLFAFFLTIDFLVNLNILWWDGTFNLSKFENHFHDSHAKNNESLILLTVRLSIFALDDSVFSEFNNLCKALQN